MPTPHNNAAPGAFAKTVLMPGSGVGSGSGSGVSMEGGSSSLEPLPASSGFLSPYCPSSVRESTSSEETT